MGKEKETTQIGFRISPEVKKKWEERAEEEGRPLSNFIKAVVNSYIDEIDKAKQLLNKK